MQIDFDSFLNLTSCAFIEFQSIIASVNFDYIHSAVESFHMIAISIITLIFDHISSPIEFTEFQLILLYSFLAVNLITVILIIYYWNKYGEIITARFVLPSK